MYEFTKQEYSFNNHLFVIQIYFGTNSEQIMIRNILWIVFLLLFCFPAGVGVPLMLTYVYGVVPMSLCRSGWCRPQSEPPETPKIQLEDLASCEYALFTWSHMAVSLA